MVPRTDYRVTPAQADGRVLGDLLVALHRDERTRQIRPRFGLPVEGPRRPAHSHGHSPRPSLGVSGPRLRGDEPDHADVRFIGHLGLLKVQRSDRLLRLWSPLMPTTQCRRPARPE